jgi:hypothetical protein
MDSQSGEIASATQPDLEIFRLGMGLKGFVGSFTEREASKSIKLTKRSTQGNISTQINPDQKTSCTDWSIECSKVTIPSSEPLLSEAEPNENRSCKEVRLERSHSIGCETLRRIKGMDQVAEEESAAQIGEGSSPRSRNND